MIASLGPQHTDFYAASVDAQGRITVVALADAPVARRLLIVRYLSNGTLDSSFGAGGVAEPVTLRINLITPAFAADGSIRAFASTTDQAQLGKVLMKIRPDGTLDPAFGNAGLQPLTNVPLAGYDDAAVQSDGKTWLLARAFGPSSGTVARFLANGPRDTSFGATGEVSTPIKTVQAMVPAGNDAVYVGGYENLSGAADGVLTKIGANGMVDTTFGNAGVARVSNPSSVNTIYRLSIDPMGRPLPTGYLDSKAVAMRFLTTGQLDTTYGNAGFANLAFWQSLTQEAFADGSLVAISRELGGLNQHFQSIHVLPNGAIDMAYGTNGIFAYASGALPNIATQLLIEPDGKIVAIGSAAPTTNNLMITRQLPDGALDPSFDKDGIALFGISVVGAVADAARSSTGNYYVLAATGFTQTIYGISPNGTLLPSFGMGGTVSEPLPAGSFWNNWGLTTDTQDRIISAAAANIMMPVAGCRIRLKRLLPTGQVDTSFDTDGWAETDLAGRTECQPRAVVELPDGKLLVGVSARQTPLSPQSIVLRYEATGALDTTFGAAGVAVVPGPMALDNLVVRASGAIVAAGHQMTMMAVAQDMAVARLTPTGQVDTTFGAGAGFVIVPTGATGLSSGIYFRGPGMVVHADESITLAGTKPVGSDAQMLIVRLLADGTLDTSYAMGGQGILPQLPGNFSAYTLAQQPSGKLIVAGRGFWPTTGTDFAIVRLSL